MRQMSDDTPPVRRSPRAVAPGASRPMRWRAATMSAETCIPVSLRVGHRPPAHCRGQSTLSLRAPRSNLHQVTHYLGDCRVASLLTLNPVRVSRHSSSWPGLSRLVPAIGRGTVPLGAGTRPAMTIKAGFVEGGSADGRYELATIENPRSPDWPGIEAVRFRPPIPCGTRHFAAASAAHVSALEF